MASSSKQPTTMAKLNREHPVHERRLREPAETSARTEAAPAPRNDRGKAPAVEGG